MKINMLKFRNSRGKGPPNKKLLEEALKFQIYYDEERHVYTNRKPVKKIKETVINDNPKMNIAKVMNDEVQVKKEDDSVGGED